MAGDLIADIVYSSGGVDLSKMPVNEVRVSSASDEDTWTTTSDSIDIEAPAKQAPKVNAEEEKDEKRGTPRKRKQGFRFNEERNLRKRDLESGDPPR